MSEEQKFDDLLSSKLSERDFPFDELNWDEAERLIIKQERWKKIFPLALFFAAGLVAGMCIMLFFIPNAHVILSNTAISKPTIVPHTVITQNTASLPENKPQENTPQNIPTGKNAPLPVQSAFVKKDSLKGSGLASSSSNESSTAKTQKEPQLLVVVAPAGKPANTQPAKSTILASAGDPGKKSGLTETIHPKESGFTGQGTPVSSIQPTNSTIMENGSPLKSAVKTDKNDSSNTTIANTHNSNNIIAAEKSTATDTASKDKDIIANDTTARTKTDSSKANSFPMLPGAIPNYAHSGDHSKNILSVYAGGNYSLGWNDNGYREAKGITPWGGINFTHYVTEKISLSLGIGYSELNNLNKTYGSSSIQYGFGATLNATNVTPQTIYELAFPLHLQYNLDSKDKISAGVDCLVMLTTLSTLTTYKETYLTETSGGSQMQNGYTQGFSNYDMQLTFSYTRMLANKLGITAEYYRDLGYIEDNSITGINQYAKNSGFRLVFSYHLMK